MKKIVALLMVVMTLTACAANEQVASASSNAVNSALQESVSANQTETANAKYAALENSNLTKETETTSEAAISDSATSKPTTPTSTTTPLPPSDDSSPIEEPSAPQESAPIEEEANRPYLEMEKEAVRLVNLEREKVGLPSLKTYDTYYKLVKIRTEECIEFWSHTRPNGEKWSSLYLELKEVPGVRKIGENLGRNFLTVEQITAALMASESHRNAILSADYTHICISIVLLKEGETENENLYAIAQHFYQKEE